MMSRRIRFLITSFFLFGISTTCSGCLWFHKEESFKSYKRSYSMNQIRIAESNTFKKLNEVIYPSNEQAKESQISDEEKEAYASFSNLSYKSVIKTSEEKNISYSPIGLYSLLNEMEYASNREELTTKLNELLGLDEESRASFYKKVMLANSFASETDTTQLKNAAFFNATFNYSQDFVNALTKLYCEAYQLDFASEQSKIVEWVNKAVNSEGFIDTKFLELTKDTELFLFSTLYFKNAWAYKYLEEDNFEDDFHLSSGETLKTTFMKHSFMSDSYYDYDKFISIKDYYYNLNASVTYLVPKSIDDDIFELTKDKNIFIDEKENEIMGENEYSPITVNLKTPKFNLKTELNLKLCLSDLGFDDMFNPDIDSFHNAFNDPNLDGYNIYVDKMKQKNEVEFNENGSIVKSVSMASMAKESAVAPARESIDVNLNQPFIYIIKDRNDTPIFVGHVDNPKIA